MIETGSIRLFLGTMSSGKSGAMLVHASRFESVEEAILRYFAYVTTCEAIMREVPRLRGLRLGCPGRCRFPLCHAAVLAQLANRPMRRAA
jgi:hypothetical protein